jgi:hypothetical protein
VVNAGVTLNLPRNNNFTASAPLGKSTALVILSSTKRNFDEILDFPKNDFAAVSAAKVNRLAQAGLKEKLLGVGTCVKAGPGCDQISVARVEFETYR